MKQYIIFTKSGFDSIEKMKVDFLKLKASYPHEKFQLNREEKSISCDDFSIKYMSIFLPIQIEKYVKGYHPDGVYDGKLLEMVGLHYDTFDVADHEFLVWIREGDLILNDFIK